VVLLVHHGPQPRLGALEHHRHAVAPLAGDALGEVDEVVLQLGGVRLLQRVGLQKKHKKKKKMSIYVCSYLFFGACTAKAAN
jgi:hypothetical protein